MKKIISMGLIVIFILSAASCAQKASSYERGLKAYQEQKYEEAETYFRRAVSQGDKSAVVKADLALTYLKLSRGDEALKTLNEAYQAGPHDTEVLKRIGLFYEETGDPYTAASFYEEAVASSEGEVTEDVLEAEGLLGVLYKENGNYERAVRAFNDLITKGYHVPEHLILAGECYLSQSQVYASTQYFDLLERCENVTPDEYLRVVQSLLEKGAKKEALQYVDRGLELIDSGKGTYSVGEFYCYAGLYDEAEAYASGRKDEGAYMTQALTAFHRDDLQACETALLAVMAENPDNIDAYSLYVLVKAREKDEKTVKQLLTKIDAKGTEKEKADALWNQIVLCESTGDHKEAYRLLKDYRKRFTLTEKVRRELKFLSRLED